MNYKFVITDGILTNLYKKKLLDYNLIIRNFNMGTEYDSDSQKDNDINYYQETETEVNSEDNLEKIDILFTNKHLKKYKYPHNVKIHNHLMNIQIFTDYFQLYLDFLNKYPKKTKKYMFNSYVYDVATNDYDFKKMQLDLNG